MKPHDPDPRESPDVPADAVLLKQMSLGDREAFAIVFRRHHRSVYRFALQMTGSADVADDVTQEVFLALARAAARYSPEHATLSTYLYGITRHLVLRREKRSRSRSEVDLDRLDERDSPIVWHDPIDGLARAERLAVLRRAILRLPIHYREVILLCEIHRLSYDAAAAAIGCPVGTIRSRLSRARRLLAERCRASPGTPDDGGRTRSALPWFLNRRPGTVGPDS